MQDFRLLTVPELRRKSIFQCNNRGCTIAESDLKASSHVVFIAASAS